MSQRIRPCLRWPGNKFSLIEDIQKLTPLKYNSYHEPFLGSGVVFLNSNISSVAYLSDYNPALINFYRQVQSHLESLIKAIEKRKNTEEYYYREREKTYSDPIQQAAQLYYLNRTCFNGIYRINSKGKFNVPYGKRIDLQIVDHEKLKLLNIKLAKAKLNSYDFGGSLQYIGKNDFVFLDPPYSAKINTNKFLMYNENLFAWDDQLRLQQYCQYLVDSKAKFILTNLYNDDVYKLFGKALNLQAITLQRMSKIGALPSSRGMIKEYLFTNIMISK